MGQCFSCCFGKRSGSGDSYSLTSNSDGTTNQQRPAQKKMGNLLSVDQQRLETASKTGVFALQVVTLRNFKTGEGGEPLIFLVSGSKQLIFPDGCCQDFWTPDASHRKLWVEYDSSRYFEARYISQEIEASPQQDQPTARHHS